MRLIRACSVLILALWSVAFAIHYFGLSLFGAWYGYPLTVTSLLFVVAVPLWVDHLYEAKDIAEETS
jgi:hypothetical protein